MAAADATSVYPSLVRSPSPDPDAPQSVRNELKMKQEEQRRQRAQRRHVGVSTTSPSVDSARPTAYTLTQGQGPSLSPPGSARPGLNRLAMGNDGYHGDVPFSRSDMGSPPCFPGPAPPFFGASSVSGRAHTANQHKDHSVTPALSLDRPAVTARNGEDRLQGGSGSRSTAPRRHSRISGHAAALSDFEYTGKPYDAYRTPARDDSDSDSELSETHSPPSHLRRAAHHNHTKNHDDSLDSSSEAYSEIPPPDDDRGAYDSDSSVDNWRRERVASFSRTVPAFQPDSEDSEGSDEHGPGSFARTSDDVRPSARIRAWTETTKFDTTAHPATSDDDDDGNSDSIKPRLRSRSRTMVSTLGHQQEFRSSGQMRRQDTAYGTGYISIRDQSSRSSHGRATREHADKDRGHGSDRFEAQTETSGYSGSRRRRA